MDDFIKVTSVDDVPDNQCLALEINGHPIAIFHVDGKYYAMEDICPHQESSFEGGELDGTVVTCPLHGWKCDITNGVSLDAPSIKLETYETKLIENDIYIRL